MGPSFQHSNDLDFDLKRHSYVRIAELHVQLSPPFFPVPELIHTSKFIMINAQEPVYSLFRIHDV